VEWGPAVGEWEGPCGGGINAGHVRGGGISLGSVLGHWWREMFGAWWYAWRGICRWVGDGRPGTRVGVRVAAWCWVAAEPLGSGAWGRKVGSCSFYSLGKAVVKVVFLLYTGSYDVRISLIKDLIWCTDHANQ
jgi:hypothetical protein